MGLKHFLAPKRAENLSEQAILFTQLHRFLEA